MRVYAVTSIHISADELVRRQQFYDRISPRDLTVELHDIGAEAPRALETPDDVRESARLVKEALLAADSAGYDALLPDCVLDPGVVELRGRLTTPLHGLLWLTLEHLTTSGQLAGMVTTNRTIADQVTAKAREYGREATLVSTSVLDVPAGTANRTQWLTALGKAVNELANAGAQVVVNGCWVPELDNARSGRVPVIDPATTALQRLAA
jgi:allantoin racemase